LLSSYRALKAAVKRVREQPRATAMLLAEDGNPHDPSAVSVWIDGLLVGYLPRDQASALRPGLLAAQEREGKPIALEGVIVKGAMRGDGGSRLSVVLRYDPEDFGLSASPEGKHAEKARYQLGALPAASTARRMSEAEIKSIVDRLADIARVLIDADPEDKAEVFRQLGLKLTYHPGRKLVEANVQLAQFGFFDGVRGGT
jgi:hypothetical protein